MNKDSRSTIEQRGVMHQDRTTDLLAQIRAAAKSAYGLCVNLNTNDLNYQQRADFAAARNEIDAAIYRIERIYSERNAVAS